MSSNADGTDRLPPQNRDAERSVLGSMLRDNTVISSVVQIVRAEDFYADAHQKIFDAIVSLHDKGGQPVDLVILGEELIKRGQIQDIGGPVYLSELWDAAPTAANAEYYARIVRDKSIVRHLIHASTEILRDAYDQSQPPDDLLGAAERKILDIAQMGASGQTTTLEQAILQTYIRLDKIAMGEGGPGGLPTGFLDLDEITAGLHPSELVIIAARPSVGKCLAHDSEIVLADGSVVNIEEVYRRRQGRLLTLQDDWQFGLTEPSAYVDDGFKPVYRVITRLGRRLETTLSHPYLTLSGWRPLAELKVGARIAVPRAVPIFGEETLPECRVKLLAYLIGDGCLTDTTPEFTNSDPRLRDDFAAAVADFGAVKVRLEDSNGTRAPSLNVAGDPAFIAQHRPDFGRRLRSAIRVRYRTMQEFAANLHVSAGSVTLWCQGVCVPAPNKFQDMCGLLGVTPEELAPHGLAAIRRSGRNPLTLWLEEMGLWKKDAHAKFIPAVVFRLTRPLLALFLNRLFATDGWACVRAEGPRQIGYATVSERLARQVQHLLLRFGIIGALKRRNVSYRGTRRRAWQVIITDQEAIRCFTDDIGIFGKEDALARVREASTRHTYKPTRDTIPRFIWGRLNQARGRESWASLARRIGLGEHANMHVGRRDLSRNRLARLAAVLGDEQLGQLAGSAIYWDEILAIEPVGLKQVYDLTIPHTHNFVANDVCVHNTAFSLNLVRNIILEQKEPVFFVSLEQSSTELAERLLCSQARVDSHRLRKGTLAADDMDRLIEAGGILRNARLFIDDSPFQGMLRIAANARRLKLRHAIKLVVIDYLQLIEPDNRRDPRQEQVAQISRRLKALAKELQLPVIALAQVNRASEDRQDHRPRLADLRESGCITGDALVTLADSGARVPIRDLLGQSGFRIWALDETSFKMKPAEVSRVFCTGRKPVYRLTTRLGRSIRATGNHKFRAFDGWRRLDELKRGAGIALPPGPPCPETAAANVCWDPIRCIEPDGEEEVFDLTVPGPHNFCCEDIFVHNSIEQDADTVMLLHRPDRYEPGQHEGIIEVIVGKNRNGPTGEITLAYLKQFMRYENYAPGTPFDG
jgi:replicative DNA helicase